MIASRLRRGSPMPLALLAVALLLFATMLLPLPAPAGLGIALWALGLGLPLPALLVLYLAQDVLSYTIIRRAITSSHNPLPALVRRLPYAAQRLIALAPRPAAGECGLLTATLLSFYAGAALAAARRTAVLRSAALVVGVDVAKYANGLAVALGAARLLPSSPLTPIAASLAGLAAVSLLALLHRPRSRPVVVHVRV